MKIWIAADSGKLDDFETETDVNDLSDVNYDDTDKQAAGIAPRPG